jgi:hypothetical protein
VRSLYQRANGYSYDAVKMFCKNGNVTKVPYVEHVSPAEPRTLQTLWADVGGSRTCPVSPISCVSPAEAGRP